MSEPHLIHHEINYIEIPALDLDQAKKFYGEAFGWKFTDYGPEYVGIQKRQGEGEVGGFCKVEKVVAGGLLVILYSNDLESSLESVKKAGGEVSLEIFSFPGGRRFQFRDPSGHELAVWSDQSPEA